MLRIALPTGIALLILGQADVGTTAMPDTNLFLSGGGLGILGWLLWYTVAKVQPRRDDRFTKTLNDMAERHERWEIQRHEDSVKLNETLRQLSIKCAETRAKMSEVGR